MEDRTTSTHTAKASGGYRLMMCVWRRCLDRSHNIRPPRLPISPYAPATGIDCYAVVRTFNIHYQRGCEPLMLCLCLLKEQPFRSVFCQNILDKVEKGLCNIRKVTSSYGKIGINKRKYQKFSKCGHFLNSIIGDKKEI